MSKIWFVSDCHFGHRKPFLYEPRGFKSIEEHDKIIIDNWNTLIKPEDEVYFLGDMFLYDVNYGIKIIKSLNGKIHFILGNHDTDHKMAIFLEECPNIFSIEYATKIKYKKYIFYLSHYPTLIHNYRDKTKIWNIHGHTHSKDKFSEYAHCYNACLEAHDNKPIEIEEVLKDIKREENNYV